MENELIARPAYLDRIKPFQDTDAIKILTGIRRGGKSALLELVRRDLLESGVQPERLVSLNLESAESLSLREAESLRDYLTQRISPKGQTTYIFLDEIQTVSGWEDVVNSLRVAYPCDIYVTGSNANLLSGDLATMIAGRYVQIEVYPFSFAEFLGAYQKSFPDAGERDAFLRFLVRGGFPYLLQLQYAEEACALYLEDLFNAVELKDIIKRAGVREPDLLERLLLYVLSNTGAQISARSLARFLKNEGRGTSVETILRYLNTGADAFLYHAIPREDLRGKRILSVADKYYCADQGLREAVIGGNMTEIQHVLENIVCLELLRRGYKVYVGENDGKEIDFVARKGAEKLYVQVAYILATPETQEREFGAFRGMDDNYPKYVVSMDEVNMSRNGIKHLNIRDFLLAKEWA